MRGFSMGVITLYWIEKSKPREEPEGGAAPQEQGEGGACGKRLGSLEGGTSWARSVRRTLYRGSTHPYL